MPSEEFKPIVDTLQHMGVSDDSIDRFVGKLRVRRFPAKQLLFSEGDVSPPIFYILSGHLRLYVSDDVGEISTRLLAAPREFIGCVQSAFFHKRSQYTCESIGDTRVIIIDPQILHDALNRDSTSVFLHQIVLQRLLDIAEEKSLMLPLKATERYVLFRERYPNLARDIPAGIIANYIGVRPQSLSRIKNMLKS